MRKFDAYKFIYLIKSAICHTYIYIADDYLWRLMIILRWGTRWSQCQSIIGCMDYYCLIKSMQWVEQNVGSDFHDVGWFTEVNFYHRQPESAEVNFIISFGNRNQQGSVMVIAATYWHVVQELIVLVEPIVVLLNAVIGHSRLLLVHWPPVFSATEASANGLVYRLLIFRM